MPETIEAANFLEFLWVWNTQQGQTTPDVHRRIARWLQTRHEARDPRLLLMAFRGCGKSTLVGLFCAWRLLLDPDLRILVLAADQPLAVKMVATVRRIIERHPLTAALRPHTVDAWAMDRFTVTREAVLRDPSMLAQGLNGNITGSRAELIVCDDVEVPGTCDTAQKRAELRERLTEMAFVLTPGGTALYVGTPHHAQSIYTAGEENFLAGFRRLRVPLLDAHGDSAWPQRFTPDAIAALRSQVGPLAFTRQMQLEPVTEAAARLDPAALIRYVEQPDYREAAGHAVLSLLGRRLAAGGGFWDPAYGRPAAKGVHGDGSVLACVFDDDQGNHYLHRIAWLTHEPDDPLDPATQQCRAVAAIARELRLPVVRVETNGLGRFLPALLRRELARAGAPCAVVEHASRRAKSERILAAIEPALAGRRLYAHESVFRTPFPVEMAGWRPHGGTGHDDSLDAVAGCLLAAQVRLPRLPPVPRGVSWNGAAAG